MLTAKTRSSSLLATALLVACILGWALLDRSSGPPDSVASERVEALPEEREEPRLSLPQGRGNARESAGAAAPVNEPAPEPSPVAEKGRPSYALVGQLVTEDGHGLPPLLRVLAWPESRPRPSGLTLAELRIAPDVLMAVAEPDGRFVIEGVERGVDYIVEAGGSGWVSPSVAVCRVGEEEHTLEVLRLFGHRLIFTEGGRAPQLNASYGGRGFGKLKRSDKGISLRFRPHWGWPSVALNADLASAIVEARQNPLAHRLVLVAIPCKAGAPIPTALPGMSLEVHLPGYERSRCSFSLRRADQGLQLSEIDLVPESGGFGSVTLRGLGDEFDAGRDSEAHLRLEGHSGRHSGRYLLGAADRADDGTFRWSGIPSAKYTAEVAWLTMDRGAEAVPVDGADSVLVPEGGTCELVIDPSKYGSVDLDLLYRGSPLTGMITVRVDQDSKMGPYRLFKRAPYHLSLLPTGPIRILLRDPIPGDYEGGAPFVDVVARQGETVRATISF